ncbi:TPA: hypothetical protein ACPULS_001106 [Escherichia coli]
MEVFWIVVGVVAVIIYVINQNKTKISDRTVVNQNKTIKTEDGEVTISRTQVIEHTSTQFQKTGGNAPDISVPPAYDSAVIQTYYKQQELAKERQLIQPKPFTAELPPGMSTRPAYHGRFPGDDISSQSSKKAPQAVSEPARIPSVSPPKEESANRVSSGRKQCLRCRINLPYDKFRKSSKNPDGLTKWCARCLDGPKNTRHMKWCPICNVRRKRTSFYPNNQNADGLMAWCKTCWDEHKAKR